MANMTFLGAFSAINAKDNNVAIKLLDQTIKREPRYFKAYYVRGQVHLVNKDYKKAYRDLIITERLCPDFGSTRRFIKLIEGI